MANVWNYIGGLPNSFSGTGRAISEPAFYHWYSLSLGWLVLEAGAGAGAGPGKYLSSKVMILTLLTCSYFLYSVEPTGEAWILGLVPESHRLCQIGQGLGPACLVAFCEVQKNPLAI